MSEARVVGFQELCRGRRFVFGYALLEVSGRLYKKDLLVHPGAVVILPLLDGERIVMVKQYRIGPREWIYELPAGTIEEGEDPRETAARELEEETGYRASRIVKLFSMYTSPGTSTEIIHAYLAQDLEYVGEKPEESEAIRVVVKNINEVLDMIRRGEIVDAKTIATILYYNQYVRRRREPL